MKNLCNCPNCQTNDCPAATEIEALQKERDALKIEYESRAIWIAKMLKALDCENHDGFHCVDAHEVATNIRAEVAELKKDKERLDRILAVGFNLSIWSSNDGAHAGFTFVNNRNDLDAAMSAENK